MFCALLGYFLLPFLRLLSRQSVMVRRLSVRKSYSTREENACRNDSSPPRRVLVLRGTEGIHVKNLSLLTVVLFIITG